MFSDNNQFGKMPPLRSAHFAERAAVPAVRQSGSAPLRYFAEQAAMRHVTVRTLRDSPSATSHSRRALSEILKFIFMNQEQPIINPDEMMREIDEFTEAMHRRLKEIDEQEARYEKRRKPLPEKIYHVTTHENAQQIMQEGLDPSKLYIEDREVVSLSDDIDFAIGVARVTRGTSPQNLVVLGIDTHYLTPSRIHNYLREAEPDNPDPMEAAAIHEVHYESTITPDAIKIIKHKPKKSI